MLGRWQMYDSYPKFRSIVYCYGSKYYLLIASLEHPFVRHYSFLEKKKFLRFIISNKKIIHFILTICTSKFLFEVPSSWYIIDFIVWGHHLLSPLRMAAHEPLLVISTMGTFPYCKIRKKTYFNFLNCNFIAELILQNSVYEWGEYERNYIKEVPKDLIRPLMSGRPRHNITK